jgi:hypothetical protein
MRFSSETQLRDLCSDAAESMLLECRGVGAKLPTAPVQRLVFVVALACGPVAFALWFDSILAADDDRGRMLGRSTAK